MEVSKRKVTAKVDFGGYKKPPAQDPNPASSRSNGAAKVTARSGAGVFAYTSDGTSIPSRPGSPTKYVAMARSPSPLRNVMTSPTPRPPSPSKLTPPQIIVPKAKTSSMARPRSTVNGRSNTPLARARTLPPIAVDSSPGGASSDGYNMSYSPSYSPFQGGRLARKASIDDDGYTSNYSSSVVSTPQSATPNLAMLRGLSPAVRPRTGSVVSATASESLAPMRIKSKVTGMVKPVSTGPVPPNPPPIIISTVSPLPGHRSRAVSISLASPSSPPSAYVNRHQRTPSTGSGHSRTSPVSAKSNAQLFSPVQSHPPQDNLISPHSPPTSTLSSLSSVSGPSSSVVQSSSGPNSASETEALGIRSLGPREAQGSGDEDGSDNDTNGIPEAEGDARSNRKIADLEITNASLLRINNDLEALKIKQSREIRDLRRRLRESRLALPPRVYKAITPTSRKTQEDASPGAADEPEEDDDDEEEDEDPLFDRLKAMIEDLTQSCIHAVEMKIPTGLGVGTAKVLTALEVEEHYDHGDQDGETENTDAEDDAEGVGGEDGGERKPSALAAANDGKHTSDPPHATLSGGFSPVNRMDTSSHP